MTKKIQQYIINLIVVFMLQAFLLVGTACAEYSSIQVSNLSPAVNISLPDFNQNFNILFSEQAAVLKQPDTIKARTEFKNNLYELPFKILFHKIIQYKLLNAVNQELLNNIEASEIVDIQVEYSSDDPVYQLFVQQGEDKLDGLRNNQQLIKLYFERTTRDRNGFEKKYIHLGDDYNPPYRARKDKQLKMQKYKEKFVLDSVHAFSGISKKELKKRNYGLLWGDFWKYRIARTFGKKLLSDVNQGKSVEFKVNIKLKDQKEIEAQICISGENFNVLVNKNNDYFKQQMHMLDTQKNDLTNVVNAIDQLNVLLDAGLAYWSSEYNPDMAKQIKNELEQVNTWLSKAKKTFNNNITKKHQAYLALNKAVKKWGYLSRNDYVSTAKQVEETLDFLEKRLEELMDGIRKRNIYLYDYAWEKNDHSLLSEVLENEAFRIDAAIKVNDFNMALEISELIKSEYLNNSEFQNKFNQFQMVENGIRKLDSAISHAEEVFYIKNAIDLINDVEGSKSDIVNIQNNIAKARSRLIEKGFSQIAKSVQEVINDLSMIKVDDKNYLSWITSAQIKMDSLIYEIENSKLNSVIKKIITGMLAEPNRNLKKTIEQANARNAAIRKVLPSVKLISLSDTLKLLRAEMDKKTNGLGFTEIKNQAIFETDILNKSLSRFQQGDLFDGELVSVGQIVTGLMRKIERPLLIGQAI